MSWRPQQQEWSVTLKRLVAIVFLILFGLTVSSGDAHVARAETPAEDIQQGSMNELALPGRLVDTQNEAGMEAILRDTTIPERDLLDLAVRLKRAPADVPRVVHTEPQPHEIGDQATFWVSDQGSLSYFQVTATLRYATPHVYMWAEDGYNVGDDELRLSGDRFESQIYPLTRELFGSEWSPGVDADPHISIFNGYVPGVGGYYSSADEFSGMINPFSNEREMFYINLDNAWPGQNYYDGILAHEFQHMIHWHSDRNETTWINEGLSELSAQMNGFETSGSAAAFYGSPDVQLTGWPDLPGQAAANYGAAHSFTNYLLERFGDGFIHDVVADRDNGMSSIDQVLRARGIDTTATDVFADWVVANYLGDPQVADGRYGHRLLQSPATLDAAHSDYPVERSADVHQYGTDYIELRGTGDLLVDFQGPTETRLTSSTAHSGEYVWWSNRGDDSDMTLTRGFDLSGVASATLDFWLWYDIETGWDYAYVEVSTDGGNTWDALQGAYTTNDNPNGNSFGWAYTGLSGGGDAPVWVQERIDLTPYVGQEIMIRFEFVTDDAVNHAGVCLDDISIPELGFADDAESAQPGWDARGFVRSNNRLPQRFLLQLIEFGPQIQVRRLGESLEVPVRLVAVPADEQAPRELSDETSATLAQVECQPYQVQAHDSLWKLAEQYLGSGAANRVLLAANNAHHALDGQYALLDNPRVIRTGATLCIPANDQARQDMLALLGSIGTPAPAPDPTTANATNTEALISGSHQFVIRGLGTEIDRAVLTVSAIAPVTTEISPYHYTITPLPETLGS